MACVYALSSSLDPDAVRYVGRSNEDDGTVRLRKHLWETRRGTRSHKCNWSNSVQSAGGVIVSTVLESGLSYTESGIREVFFIANYRGRGFDLTNLTDGGDGTVGLVFSAERRKNIGDATRGKIKGPYTPEHCANISAGKMGGIRSGETRARISATLTGRTLPPEHCAAISDGNMGRTVSAETRKKISDAQKGEPHSPEHCENLRLAWVKRRAREKLVPQKRSPEAKQNMRLAWQKRRLVA